MILPLVENCINPPPKELLMSNRCDKCGREVPFANNAVVLESIRLGIPDLVIWAEPCHLLPVIENGKVVCPGSPSRAKYLNGYRTVKVFFLESVEMLNFEFAYKEMQRLAVALEARS